MTTPYTPRMEAELPSEPVVIKTWRAHGERLPAELRDVLRAYDALRAYAERVVPPVAPRRVPPNHKGVEYRNGVWYLNGTPYVSAAHCIADSASTLTDDDHKHLLALRDAQPSDPVREGFRAQVMSVLDDVWHSGRGAASETWRGMDKAVDEMNKIADELTDAALALIDQHAAPELTAEQCIARLVALGIAKPNDGRLVGSAFEPTHFVYFLAPERAL